MAVGMLSSCYTNVNQLWFKGKREYEVSHLDYHTDAAIGVHGLPPQLYKHGNDWYIAAKYNKQKDAYPGRCVQWVGLAYEERHGFELRPNTPVYYHKITPEMAQMLLRSDAGKQGWFSEQRMREALSKAGGAWEPTLPQGAKPVHSEFLRRCHSSLMLVDEHNHASWVRYPGSWLTFLCVDVPASVFTLMFGPFYGSYAAAAYDARMADYECDTLPPPSGGSSDSMFNYDDPFYYHHGSSHKHHHKPSSPPSHGHHGSKPGASSPPHHGSGGHGGGAHHGGGHHGGGLHGGGHHGSGSLGGGHHGGGRHHSSSSSSGSSGGHRGNSDSHHSKDKR